MLFFDKMLNTMCCDHLVCNILDVVGFANWILFLCFLCEWKKHLIHHIKIDFSHLLSPVKKMKIERLLREHPIYLVVFFVPFVHLFVCFL